ncbi:MAG: methionyl-tRNA formyltransferase, partial [Desulfomonilaceae bacterium]
ILNEWKPDVVVVVAYGKFLPKEILDLPPLGCLNLHASLLPRHRGPSPISAAILAGDNLTGNTIMLLDGGMDTGRILAKQTVEIRAKDSAGDLHDRLMELGAVLMVETLKKLINDEIIPVPQNETEATYSRLLRKTDGLLDWNLSAKQLDRIVRAMDPWPVAYFPLGHEQIKVWRSTVLEGRAEPGLITNVGPQGLVVGTGSGLLRLEEVRAPSRKKIMGSDFARGKRLKPGDYLI